MKIFSVAVDRHISLRALVPGDAEDLYRVVQANRQASQWLPWIGEAKGPAPDYLAQNSLVPAPGRRTTLGIFCDNLLVGQIEFDPQDESAAPGVGSLGYFLDKNYSGKGIVTRACSAVLDYAFQEMKLIAMEIHCRPGNLPSIKVAKRLGFDGGEPDARIDGQLLFIMTSGDWKALRAQS